jgi:hypothetical protein
MREKASLFRAVRKRTNSVWFWEQAAESTAFRAALGPPLFAGSLGVLAELPSGLELDSCASALAAASRKAQLKKLKKLKKVNNKKLERWIYPRFLDFTSILCQAQYGR